MGDVLESAGSATTTAHSRLSTLRNPGSLGRGWVWIAAVAMVLLSLPLFGQGSGFCGVIDLQGGNGVIYVSPNVSVKFCTQTDGTQCVGPVVADSGGNYSVPAPQSGNYYMYAWRDDIYWGSASRPLDPYAIVYVASGYCQYIQGLQASRPRPNPPGLVAPAMNSQVRYDSVVLTWTAETDPLRVNSNWPIVYDVFASTNGGAESQIASNVACCSRTVPAGTLPAGSAVSWRVVAKMNTKVGGNWDQTRRPSCSTTSRSTRA